MNTSHVCSLEHFYSGVVFETHRTKLEYPISNKYPFPMRCHRVSYAFRTELAEGWWHSGWRMGRGASTMNARVIKCSLFHDGWILARSRRDSAQLVLIANVLRVKVLLRWHIMRQRALVAVPSKSNRASHAARQRDARLFANCVMLRRIVENGILIEIFFFGRDLG